MLQALTLISNTAVLYDSDILTKKRRLQTIQQFLADIHWVAENVVNGNFRKSVNDEPEDEESESRESSEDGTKEKRVRISDMMGLTKKRCVKKAKVIRLMKTCARKAKMQLM